MLSSFSFSSSPQLLGNQSPVITTLEPSTWLIAGAALLLFGFVGLVYWLHTSLMGRQKHYYETLLNQQTAELRRANHRLEQEMSQRLAAEESLAKQAEAELQVSEARFRAIFDHAAVGIGIQNLDRQVIDANPAICEMLGMQREELIGRTSALVLDEKNLQDSIQSFHELLNSRQGSYITERQYRRKNGELFWAQVMMTRVCDQSGEPVFVIGMIVDIDEKKRTQERLIQSEERFRAIYDYADMGIVTLDLEEHASPFRNFDNAHILNMAQGQYGNPAFYRMFGYEPGEMEGLDRQELIYEEDRGLDVELFGQLLEGKRDYYRIEKRYVRKDGSLFYGRLKYSLVRASDGSPRMAIGLIEDITEEKLTQQKLDQQEREYRQNLEERVHERTLELERSAQELSNTNTRLQLEIEQRRRAEEALAAKAAEEAVVVERTRLARDLHDAVTQTLFSASLIAEVLPDLWDIDREEACKSTEELRQLTRGALAEMRTLLLELRPAALTQTRLEDLLRQLAEALIGRARLPISLTVDGERLLPPEVQVAFYRIAQESLNNVVKYARASQVNVSLALSPAGAHMEITDNGTGFDTKRVKPTSLGQRIMRERAEAIDAELSITSTLGQGTMVSVTWVEQNRE